jgi:hypothetical protein
MTKIVFAFLLIFTPGEPAPKVFFTQVPDSLEVCNVNATAAAASIRKEKGIAAVAFCQEVEQPGIIT